uniref:HORMA domain-containing protein n=1 Tax=Romanomermis culicivorax TaxID=13658 RepID=A0A915JVU9_ROMCU
MSDVKIESQFGFSVEFYPRKVGIFDAMKRRYLRQVILGISCDSTNAEKVVEAYTFRFHYTEDGPSVTMCGQNSKYESSNLIPVESSKGDVVRLIRQMSFFVRSLENLPSSDAYFTIKLLYFDDRTPTDYEPPGFEAAKTEDFDFGMRKIVTLDMGRVKTSFHTCRVGVRSTLSVELEKSLSSSSKENKSSTISHAKKKKINGSEKILEEINQENIPATKRR